MTTRLLRHFAVILLVSSAIISSHGEQLTPSQALARIGMPSMSASSTNAETETPVYTATVADGSFAAYYVFDRDKGYLVVSADDVAYPLLGYSDKGKFDLRSMPDNMAWWLDCYKRQIEWAITNATTARQTVATSQRSPISPLLKSLWNQESPYNMYCPEINDTIAPTGCVATAMAQIMYYHKWPQKGKGSNSYSLNGQTLSIDFSQITFDWSNMTDTYSASSTSIQNEAVATLMKACGYAVNMEYGTQESAATSSVLPNAYYNYFGYDESVVNLYRDYYPLSDWEDLMYGELADGRPIQYGGSGSAGGHSFVVDGYSEDGYFHINWGWSGMSDGYFKLMALDPASLGTGGGAGGFNSNQTAVIGIQYGQSGNVATPVVLTSDGFSSSSTTTSVGQTVSFYPNSGGYMSQGSLFFNGGAFTVTGNLGIKIVDTSDNSAQYVSGSTFNAVKPNYGTTGFSIVIPEVEPGIYQVYPAFHDTSTGSWVDVRIPVSTNQYLIFQVNGSNVTISSPSTYPDLTVTDIEFPDGIISKQSFSVTATAVNSGATFYDLVYGVLLSQNNGQYSVAAMTGSISLEVDANNSQSFDFSGTAGVAAGTYYFAFAEVSGSSLSLISTPIEVTVTAEGTLSITKLSLETVNNVVPKDNIVINGEAKATGGGINQPLTIVIFPNFSESSDGSVQAVGSMQTDGNVVVKDGETAAFSAHGSLPSGEVGKQYFIYARTSDDWVGDRVLFTLGDDVTTGVNAIDSGEDEIEIIYDSSSLRLYVTSNDGNPLKFVEIYSVDGERVLTSDANDEVSMSIDMSQLTPGLYLVRAVSTKNHEIDKIKYP